MFHSLVSKLSKLTSITDIELCFHEIVVYLVGKLDDSNLLKFLEVAMKYCDKYDSKSMIKDIIQLLSSIQKDKKFINSKQYVELLEYCHNFLLSDDVDSM